mgnify:CR=1 FL=1
MICPGCGAENVDTAVQCSSCGQSILSTPLTQPALQLHYASFWRRFGAALLDLIIVGIGDVILGGLFMIFLQGINGQIDQNIMDASGVLFFWALLFLLVVNWLYFAITESSIEQGTPGKILARAKVVDSRGTPIGFGRATARYWAKYLSTIILGVGFILAGVTRKRQALHDMLAGTLVIHDQE